MSDKRMNRADTITAGCLFAGMGGFACAIKRANIRPLWANELDANACKTFRRNHRDINLVERDVRELSVAKDNLQPVDILTAGFPCQSFSQAGRKTGFADERGECFYEIPRLLKEFGDDRPGIVLLENVRNLMHGGGGLWFGEVIRQIQAAGYWFKKHTCRILNTAELTGIPQHRPRLFMAAFSVARFPLNFYKFPDAEAKPRDIGEFIRRARKAGDEHYLSPDNRYCKEIRRAMEKGDSGAVFQLRRYYARENKNRLCPTLTANMGGGGWNIPFVKDRWGVRELTVEECLMLQGFDDYAFPDDVPRKERYRQIGNSVTVPLAAMLVANAAACLYDMPMTAEA
ncbi:MAG: DNA cytosine methyltransferase [Gammaproteobacteria bacterium]